MNTTEDKPKILLVEDDTNLGTLLHEYLNAKGFETTLKKNGQEFPINLAIAELSPDEKNNIRYVGTCHDLSAFTEQQNKLQRIDKMDALGKLTGGIAHDFNNILGIVSGFGELLELELEYEHNPKLLTYCRQIITASERGIELTRKLLSFTKKERKKNSIINNND